MEKSYFLRDVALKSSVIEISNSSSKSIERRLQKLFVKEKVTAVWNHCEESGERSLMNAYLGEKEKRIIRLNLN